VSLRDCFNKAYDVNVAGTQVMTWIFMPLLLKSTEPRLIFVAGLSSITQASEKYFPTPPQPAGWRSCSFYIPHQVGPRGSCSLPLHPSVLGPRGSCSLPLHPSVLFGRNQRSLPDTCSIHSQQSIPLSLALSLCQCRSSHLVLGPFRPRAPMVQAPNTTLIPGVAEDAPATRPRQPPSPSRRP